MNFGGGWTGQPTSRSLHGFPECCSRRGKGHGHSVPFSLTIRPVGFPSSLCRSLCPSLLLPGIEVPDKLYSMCLRLNLSFLGSQAKTMFKPKVVIFRGYLLILYYEP